MNLYDEEQEVPSFWERYQRLQTQVSRLSAENYGLRKELEAERKKSSEYLSNWVNAQEQSTVRMVKSIIQGVKPETFIEDRPKAKK